MTKKANKELLNAVLEPRKQGALETIAAACSAGADPNAVCPECSTSTGPVRGGSTLLTHSIHECASNAVRTLLECRADPNLTDQNGWTPWMASTLVDGSKRSRIQDALLQFGANKTGDHIGELTRAIANGDVDQASTLIQSDRDLKVLSTFRVDLVGHQVRNGNAPMLELLLERKMQPTSTHRIYAIRNRKLAALDLLLRFGMAPEDPDDDETPLMTAAAIGDMKIVQRLVEAGADVNRAADKKGEWTAAFYARQAGKNDISDWLAARMGEETLDSQDVLKALRDPKYHLLYEQATASESLSSDDIVQKLMEWDGNYGVSVTDAKGNSLTIEFSSLPKSLDDFYREVLVLCPDAAGNERVLLQQLRKSKQLSLWWD